MQKTQLYDQLALSVMSKTIKDVISSVRDLSLIKGEINNLVSFCIDLYAKYYLCRNLVLVRKMCTDIQGISSISRKNITSNTSFNNLISEIFCLLTLTKYKQRNWFTTDVDVGDVEVYVLRYVDATSVSDFALSLSDEARTYMGILLACIKKRDKTGVRKLLDFLLFSKQIVVCNEIEFDDISHIKDESKADIVWYMWKLLISHVAKTKEEREFCRCHLYLYSVYYQKKYRNNRINILYFCYLLFASRKTVDKKDINVKQFASVKNKKSAGPSVDYLKHIVYRTSSISDKDKTI